MKRFITKFNYKLSAVVVIFFLLAIALGLGLPQKNISIVPSPQDMEFKGFKVKIDKNWCISVDTSNKENVFSARFLNEKLNDKLMIRDINSGFKTRHIILAISKDDFEEKNKICMTDKIGQEGYILEVFPASIVIMANTPTGVFYGIQTLLQLIEASEDEIIIPGVKIVDYPAIDMRGVHILGLQGNVNEIKEKLDFMANLRINTVIFSDEALWILEEDSLRSGRKNSSVFQELFEYARERHIEPIPELQSFGIAAGILRKEPHAAEGIWVQDEPFKWIDNMARPLVQSEIPLENPGFETSVDGNRTLDGWTFGTEYGRNDWSLDKTTSHSGDYSAKINVLANGNIRSNHLKSKWVKVDSDTAYSLTFYAKKTAGSGVDYNFAMRISQYDKNNDFIVENYWPLQYADATWKKHELSFVTQPDTSKICIWAAIIDSYGTAWFDDFELKRMNSELINVIRTEASDLVVTNLDKSKTYVEGVDYIVIDGEMKYPYFVNYNNPTKIKRIWNGNIKEDEVVLVSYDFVLRFHPAIWITPYCPSEPRVYKIFFETLKDIIYLLNPNYINIGHDDIYGIGRDSRCKKRNMTIDELLAEDINKLNGYIHNINPNVKMMIWDDMINPWHTGGKNHFQMNYCGSPGKTSNAINLISKDIIPMAWWYSSNDHMNKMKNTPACFKSKGFNYVVAGWKDKKNIKKWLEIIKDKEECMGIIATTWDGWNNNIEGIEYTARMSWSM